MVKEVSCGIIPLYKNSDGGYEVLLVRHKKGRHRWFPKWGIQANETRQQTAQRECKEETGLDFSYLDPHEFVEGYQFQRNGTMMDKEVYYFAWLARDKEVMLDPVEIKAFQWVPIDQVHHQLTFYSTRQLWKKVFMYLSGK